uniref:Uncharacterized protein LOC108950651 n=1 Tax=Phallusia mammillata TaxID=59560 RepID=A0A6F9DJK1_9ASCI|nr:uncharacterized protein LOC108950651 [Phallusia mammillata]
MPNSWYRQISDTPDTATDSLCSTTFSIPREQSDRESCDLDILDSDELENDEDIETYLQTQKNLSKRQSVMALTLAKLKVDCNLSETSLVLVQNWAECLLEECAKTIIGGVKRCQGKISPEMDEVFQIGMSMANPFHAISTEMQRKDFFPIFVVS